MYNEKTNTKEYRGAFYDWIRKSVKGESATEERSALTVKDNKIAIPKSLDAAIWDNIHTAHPMWDDLDVQNIPGELEVTRMVGKNIYTGSSYVLRGEPDLYVTTILTGQEIRKTVNLSYAAAEMSNGALEDYLASELSADIADAATEYIVDKLVKTCHLPHDDLSDVMYNFKDDEKNYNHAKLKNYASPPRNEYNTGGIGINTTTEKTIPYSETNSAYDRHSIERYQRLNYNWLCRVIGACNSGNAKLYTSRYHGFTKLYGMTDSNGQPIFRKSKILDCPVVLDDGLIVHSIDGSRIVSKSYLFALDPAQVVVNVIRPLTIEITKKPSKGVIEITASMRLDATMRRYDAFAFWQFTAPEDEPPVEYAALTVALAAPVATDVEDGDYDNYAVVDGLYTGDTAENADAWIGMESTGTTPEYDYANTDTGYYKPGDTVDVTVETDSNFFDGTKTAVLSADGAIAPEDGEEITGNGNTYTVTIPNRENNTLMVHLNRTADGTSATPGDYEIMTVDVDDDGVELPPERKKIVIRRKHQDVTPEKQAPKRSRRKRG